MSENSFGSLLPNLAYLKIKHALDMMMAVAALPCFILVTLLVAPLIFATCGWPIFYVQERIGYRGNRYKVYKFRTMFPVDGSSVSDRVRGKMPACQVEELREAAMTRDGDRRITPIGGFLRRYRIDELPQILNILKGEMSWIGPRPEAISLAKWYESELDFYPYRHVVKSGISGWAQVNQGHVTGTSEVLEKLHYDFFYIKYLSPWLDLLIILKTVRTVLFGIGAK
jgi:lipopolysaccharide/colanic/teichoic acid biosynthesis glycosyltransferase